MIKRTFRGLVQLLGGLGAGLAIVMVLAAWRLSSGPISLAFLSPYIENVLSREHGAVRVLLDDTILTWAGWERTLDIRVVNVRALGPDGEIIAKVPELALSLSARGLLSGKLAPKRIELFRPSLKLVRHPEGNFEIGFNDTKGTSDKLIRNLFESLGEPPDTDRVMSYLSRFSIIDADLTYVDMAQNVTWRAPSVQVKLWRDRDGVQGEAVLDVDVEEKTAQVILIGGYRAADKKMSVDIGFSDVKPAVFSRLLPALKLLASADLPLSGSVTLGMNFKAGGGVGSVAFELTGGAGYLAVPVSMAQGLGRLDLAQRIKIEKLEVSGRFEGSTGVYEITDLKAELGRGEKVYLPAPIDHEMPLTSFSAKGRYFSSRGRIDLTSFNADLGGAKARLSAVIEGIGAAPTVTAEGTLRGVAFNEFERYWPRALGTDAFDWVKTHMSDGTMTEAKAKIRLSADAGGAWRMDKIDGILDLKNVTVDYLAPLPKARKLSGRVVFNAKRLDITVTEGQTGGLKLTSGTIALTGLDRVDQYADMDFVIEGPVKNALRLVDREPLGFASALGIDPERTAGQSSTRLKLKFIVEKTLTPDQVEVSAKSEMKGVRIDGVVLGLGLNEGRLKIDVDKKGMTLSGEAALGKIPATLSWRKNFGKKPPFRGRYDVTLFVADVQDIRDVTVDLGPLSGDFVAGSLGVEFRLTDYDAKPSRLEATADLSGLALTVPVLGWSKDVGVAGTAAIDMDFKDGLIRDIPRFSVNAGDLSVNGAARFSADGTGLKKIELDNVTYGRTDVSGAMTPGDDGGWTVSFYGKSFNLEPLLDSLFKDEGPDGEPAEKPGMRVSLSADIDRVWLGENEYLEKVTGTFSRDGYKWRGLSVDGSFAGGKRFKMSMTPGEKGNRVLSIKSEDAGAMLKVLGYYKYMVGGSLDMSATFDDMAPGAPLKGKLLVKDYRIIEAPVLAHLVSIMALTGILESLEGDGLAFSSLDVPFTLSKGVLDLKDAKATGLSLGYTATGRIYTYAQVIDLKGTVVPAYALNAALGAIPVLGTLFTGAEEGGGVFAATYTMTGKVEKPKVSMNPLTVLAPGIFRKLFGIFEPDEKTETMSELLEENTLTPGRPVE